MSERGVFPSLNLKGKVAMIEDKEKVAQWQQLKIDDIVQLSDEQTLSFLMDEGHKDIANGADFTIKRRRVITCQDAPIKWIILDIEFGDILWYLIVKIIKHEFELKIMYIPDDFEEGNRADMLDSGSDWVFEKADFENCELPSLVFSQKIFQNDDGQDEDIVYVTEGPRYGLCMEDGEKSFATVVEYETKSDCENPESLTLEFNNVQEWRDEEESLELDAYGDVEIETEITEGIDVDEENSFITFLQGCKVNINDVKLWK
ncbi:MAG: hypothetical protein ACTSSP_03055 [Candidatus Asgardarchaeia archaeon]